MWSGVMEGGGLMGNDGGGRQWWGLMEGEGVVCWVGSICPQALVVRGWGLVVVRGWRVAHGGSLLFGVGYRRPCVGHCRPQVGHLWWGIVVRAWALSSVGGASPSVQGAHHCL